MNLTEKPTVPGWYWVKRKNSDQWSMMKLVKGEFSGGLFMENVLCGKFLVGANQNCQFFGPLPTPDRMVEAWEIKLHKVGFGATLTMRDQNKAKLIQSAVRHIRGSIGNDWMKVWKVMQSNNGYTCRPVLVVEGGGE